MKMVRRFFLAWCVLTSCVVSGRPMYVLQGQTFHKRPKITGQPDEILWKQNGNKLVEFNGKEEEVYGKHQHRVTLDWVTAELTITDVRSEDSGEYELEVYRSNELIHFRCKLQVIGRVAKPTISCDLSNGNSNTQGTWATLTCSAEPTDPQSLLQYEWQSHGNVLPGPKLTINLEEDADQIHICVVSNPLTNETATFTSKSCYSDPPVALAASLVMIFIVLICVALAIVFCRLKRKACFATKIKDEEQPAESKHLLNQGSTLPSHQRLFQGDDNMEAGVSSHSEDEDNGHRHEEGHNTDLQDETPKQGQVKKLIRIFTPEGNGPALPPDTHRESKKKNDENEELEAGVSSHSGHRHGAGHNMDLQDEAPKPDLEKNTDQDEGANPAVVRKLSFCQDQDSPTSNDDADVDEDQLRRNSGTVLEAGPDPAESKRKDDENEEAQSPPANGNSPPTADTCPPLTQSSPDMRTREGANSDQDNEDIYEENVTECHSTGSVKSTKSEEQPPSTGSETASHVQDPQSSQDEMHTHKDNQQDLGDQTLSKDESELVDESNPKQENTDLEEDLYLDTSEQPHQSPTQTEPDDSKTDKEGLNTEVHADPEQEPENMRRPKSEEPEEQSASSTPGSDKGEGEGEGEDTDEENIKDQCGPKEEKTGNLDMSEDKEREMKTEKN